VCRLERQSWLESELNNCRQRLEELSVVLQNKVASERYPAGPNPAKHNFPNFKLFTLFSIVRKSYK
jgi:hypothetical protein